jgi:hypothetical protein
MELLLLHIAWFSFIFVLFQGIAAGPTALPEVAPAPEAEQKFVHVDDEALSIKELEVRQSYYAFSGAVYIVGSGGEEFTAAEPAQCPAEVPQACANINVYNW